MEIGYDPDFMAWADKVHMMLMPPNQQLLMAHLERVIPIEGSAQLWRGPGRVVQAYLLDRADANFQNLVHLKFTRSTGFDTISENVTVPMTDRGAEEAASQLADWLRAAPSQPGLAAD